MSIDLIWLGPLHTAPLWPLGEVRTAEPTPQGIHQCTQAFLEGSKAEAWLFWDPSLGAPDPDVIQDTLSRPGDLWHAGLKLGTGGAPGLLDFVQPIWMLNTDPDPTLEATSWRVSLRACLIRTDVLRQMEGIRPEFETLDGAALELGYRYLQGGVLCRNVPALVGNKAAAGPVALSLMDEARFVHYRSTSFWTRWALMRAAATGYVSASHANKVSRALKAAQKPENRIYQHPEKAVEIDSHPRIMALVPTVDRYPYLRVILNQLREQTVRPCEVFVVDQTPLESRDTSIAEEFSDLPIQVIYQEKPGQCTARNNALERSRSDYFLFLDDDVEIEPDLTERHLRTLELYRADASCGVADEVGAGPLPEAFKILRASDVFPTGNTLIKREALIRSGLFDLAYDNGRNEDGDLGTRVYLSGGLMVLNPDISVLHHRAPRGGLRIRNDRTITYASSRQNLFHRNVSSVSEIYQWLRYYSPRQVREMLWMQAFATFSARGGKAKKIMKMGIGAASLPKTYRELRERQQKAEEMLKRFPKIPALKPLTKAAQE